MFLIVILAVFAGLFWWLFLSGFFAVTAFSVKGGQASIQQAVYDITNQWLEAKPLFLPRKSNSMFFNPANSRAVISAALPKLASVEVTKISIHEFNISITERQPAGIWCHANNSCFYFDNQGIIYENIGQTEGHVYILINDQRSREIKIGDSIVTDHWLDTIQKTRDSLKGITGLVVSRFTISDEANDEFEAISDNGTRLRLTSNDPQTALVGLAALLKDKPQLLTQQPPLKYFDLRIPNRIFYK